MSIYNFFIALWLALLIEAIVALVAWVTKKKSLFITSVFLFFLSGVALFAAPFFLPKPLQIQVPPAPGCLMLLEGPDRSTQVNANVNWAPVLEKTDPQIAAIGPFQTLPQGCDLEEFMNRPMRLVLLEGEAIPPFQPSDDYQLFTKLADGSMILNMRFIIADLREMHGETEYLLEYAFKESSSNIVKWEQVRKLVIILTWTIRPTAQIGPSSTTVLTDAWSPTSPSSATGKTQPIQTVANVGTESSTKVPPRTGTRGPLREGEDTETPRVTNTGRPSITFQKPTGHPSPLLQPTDESQPTVETPTQQPTSVLTSIATTQSTSESQSTTEALTPVPPSTPIPPQMTLVPPSTPIPPQMTPVPPSTPISPQMTPVAPSTPISPASPVAPSTPSLPSTPIAPSTPVLPQMTPIAPSTPISPATPIAPSTPVPPDTLAPFAPESFENTLLEENCKRTFHSLKRKVAPPIVNYSSIPVHFEP